MKAFKVEILNSGSSIVKDRKSKSINPHHNPVYSNISAVVTSNTQDNIKDMNAPDFTNVSSIISTVPDIDIKVSSANHSSLPHMMAGIILNNNFKCEMELDTAADHCIMSQELFDDLSLQSNNNPPVLEVSSVTMKLADGSPSESVKGRTLLSVARADMPDKAGIFPVFVVDGPHTLLGRPALRELWPDLYTSWSNAANQSIDALQLFPTVTPHVDVLYNSNITTVAAAATTPAFIESPLSPPTRPIPPPPTGEVTQEMGEAYCKQLCDNVFPELFDGGLGTFKGVEATIHLKEGHGNFLKVMPEFNEKLTGMYATGRRVDGRGLIVASQIVPVGKNKIDKRKLRCVQTTK